ncbi:MAG: MarR family winged helix-turn-helix transcriptional regulator [Lachnospiraceae bacterium]|nr:MarR family winged helix-turn-helix transcriptional regulator [Lachnospiraceae bacterium]
MDKEIPDEVIINLISEIHLHTKTNSFKKMPDSFYRLAEYISNKIQSDYFGEYSAHLGLTYGKLWSINKFVKIAEKEDLLKFSIDDDAKLYHKRYHIFKMIKEKSNIGGIAQNDLAKVADMSASAFSQFIGKFENGKYFISRQLGRNKFYYITDNGKILLEKMERLINADRQESKKRVAKDFQLSPKIVNGISNNEIQSVNERGFETNKANRFKGLAQACRYEKYKELRGRRSG